uniref:rRNA biogenesis protein RRP36 n=1 Tax=Anopheles epiroticus TaxID=199890 RepID=A0A182P865_9DIPT
MDSSENSSDSEYSVENEGLESSPEDDDSSDSNDTDDDDDNNEDEDVPKLAEDEYKQMPFEELLQLQKRLGVRVYNEAIFGKSVEKKPNVSKVKPSTKAKRKSASESESSDSDSGPEEVTSKKQVPALGMGKKNRKAALTQPRDPRFDPRQGYFSGRQFRNNYSFLNDLRKKELRKLNNKLLTVSDPEEANKLKFVIQRTENQMREYAKQKDADAEKMREKQQIRAAIKEGKRPFFERKSTKQARALVEKYDKLKDAGGLEKHIDKRRKKISAKDRKKLDFST